jgi:hypothetical protein
MRDRPFIAANEPPRPYSEIRRERSGFDLVERVLAAVDGLEADAFEAENPAEAKRLQCEAEDLRCALEEHRPRGFR